MLSGLIRTSYLYNVFYLMGVPRPALPVTNDRCATAAAAAAAPPVSPTLPAPFNPRIDCYKLALLHKMVQWPAAGGAVNMGAVFGS